MPLPVYARNGFIAGPYSARWGTDDAAYELGITEDGFEMELNYKSEVITGDNLGDTPQDAVHRGAEFFLNFVLEEAYRENVIQLLWPFDVDTPNSEGVIGDVGRLATEVDQPLILVPLITPGIKYLFYRCTIADNFPIRQILAARLRKVPIRMMVFPYYVDGLYKWYAPSEYTP